MQISLKAWCWGCSCCFSLIWNFFLIHLCDRCKILDRICDAFWFMKACHVFCSKNLQKPSVCSEKGSARKWSSRILKRFQKLTCSICAQKWRESLCPAVFVLSSVWWITVKPWLSSNWSILKPNSQVFAIALHIMPRTRDWHNFLKAIEQIQCHVTNKTCVIPLQKSFSYIWIPVNFPKVRFLKFRGIAILLEPNSNLILLLASLNPMVGMTFYFLTRALKPGLLKQIRDDTSYKICSSIETCKDWLSQGINIAQLLKITTFCPWQSYNMIWVLMRIWDLGFGDAEKKSHLEINGMSKTSRKNSFFTNYSTHNTSQIEGIRLVVPH